MPRVRVKLCGMMTPADAKAAADAGADAIGMILHADAKRKIDAETALSIVTALPPYVTPIGVFVNALPSLVTDLAKHLHLDTVQFHGNETVDDLQAVPSLKVIKVIKADQSIRQTLDEWRDLYTAGRCANLCGILLESAVAGAHGGTGVANDFNLIRQIRDEGCFDGLPPVIISGGLTPENVGGVVDLLDPYAVDTSSGIESSYGKKSAEKMQQFVQKVIHR